MSTHVIPRVDVERLLQDFLHCLGVVLNYGLVQQQVVLEDCGKCDRSHLISETWNVAAN
jgi:hypothetical protein